MDHRIEDSLQYVHAEACVTIDAPVESIWNMILLFLPTIRETLLVFFCCSMINRSS